MQICDCCSNQGPLMPSPNRDRFCRVATRASAAILATANLLAAATLLAESPDRQAAQWTILMGGSVAVDGRPERIREIRNLPDGEFRLELIDLVGTNILPP